VGEDVVGGSNERNLSLLLHAAGAACVLKHTR